MPARHPALPWKCETGQINAAAIALLAANTLLRYISRKSGLLGLFSGVLEKNPQYCGIYLGTGDGDFYEVINLDVNPRARRELKANPADHWPLMETDQAGESGTRRLHYLDEILQVRAIRIEVRKFNGARAR